jgi:predicted metal-dependent peptidase
MTFSEARIRSILQQLVDEDQLACRALFGICSVVFTTDVPTAAVSLGHRSRLMINLEFMNTHCRTDDDVRFILLHEFMHVLLRHTWRFKRATPLLNVTLDAMINSTLYRMLGAERCVFPVRFYRAATGVNQLLGPPDTDRAKPPHPFIEELTGSLFTEDRMPTLRFHQLHHSLYSSCSAYTFHDLRELLQQDARTVDMQLLLGDHSDGTDNEDLPPHLIDELARSAWPAIAKAMGEPGNVDASEHQAAMRWQAGIRPLLKRLLAPDPAAYSASSDRVQEAWLPVLSTSDRRAALRSSWAPFLPTSMHQLTRPHQGVVVYLDVSGSMDSELPLVLGALAGFKHWLAKPLWAFSTRVEPATFRNGRLITRSTGGTKLQCVYEHLRTTRARKALLITDGYVEKQLEPPPCPVEALITHKGYAGSLEKAGIPLTRLPAFEHGNKHS